MNYQEIIRKYLCLRKRYKRLAERITALEP